MTREEDKVRHSKKIHNTDTKIKKQVKIAKGLGATIKSPHQFAKMHAANCGNPNCVMCGNPRKVWKEETIQEKRFKQTDNF